MFQERIYRSKMGNNLKSFVVKYKETDLWIGIDEKNYSQKLYDTILDYVKLQRSHLDEYIKANPNFLTSLMPMEIVAANAPAIIKKMSEAAKLANVGPMAAVAGAFSEMTANYLLDKGIENVIVENGGDIYISMKQGLTLSVFAGTSPFSEKIGFIIDSELMPIAACTSAGKVGHSLNFGAADAVVVLAKSGSVADAYATFLSNLVKDASHIEKVIELAKQQPLIEGLIIIVNDKIGIWGNIKLCPIC